MEAVLGPGGLGGRSMSHGIVRSCSRPSLVSRKWLHTLSVIRLRRIQITLLWIPACAGKTIVGRERRIRLRRTDVKLFTRQYNRCASGAGACLSLDDPWNYLALLTTSSCTVRGELVEPSASGGPFDGLRANGMMSTEPNYLQSGNAVGVCNLAEVTHLNGRPWG